MARIVAGNAPFLKRAGFRKRRHTFNRATADGLVHVVFFWMAPKEPPAWTEVPGLREPLYGHLRLDFGVYVPEMRRGGVPKSDWINEYNCQLRRTMGQLMSGDHSEKLWWSLEDQHAEDVARIGLRDHGLPWLDRFPDKQAVLDRFNAVGPLELGMAPAGDLDIAEMLTSSGRSAEALRVLEAYVDRPTTRGHAAYLADYLPRIGHADLVPTIRTKAPSG
jgi:hypothetical protein